jgi:hypothetical protein
MRECDLEKYTQEVNEMQMLPAALVELPPLAALAIISHIQVATRHPEVTNTEFAKIAIDVAKQLQNLFNQNSETYKVLELGWNPEADILTPSGELDDKFCDEPCGRFLQNLGCRCTSYDTAELLDGGKIPFQTLAARVAKIAEPRGEKGEHWIGNSKTGDTCQG